MTDAECTAVLKWTLSRFGLRGAGLGAAPHPASGFDGQDAEPLATSDAQCLEVTQVQGQDLRTCEPFAHRVR
jgi:hypothetical protein